MSRIVIGVWCLCSLLLSSTSADSIETAALNRKSDISGRFRRSPIPDFSHAFQFSHKLAYLYQTGAGCGGVAIGDVNMDGLPDVYLVNGPGDNRLYRQRDQLQFDDVTAEAGLLDSHSSWGVGAAMGDVDNDGDLDIYVCNYDAPNLLYLNDGTGNFQESAKPFGLDIVDACYMPAFCDFDRDGDLDVYILTNRYYDPVGDRKSRLWSWVDGEPRLNKGLEKYYWLDRTNPRRPSALELGRADYLLRNDGPKQRQFTNVTREAGLRGRGDGLSATWWDYNEDGWPDLYVGNDFSEPDRLYRNNRDGTFTNVAPSVIPHCPWFSMGADVGDLNGDNRLDFLIADMSATNHFKQKVNMGDMGAGRSLIESRRPIQLMRNALYLNTGTRRMLEAAKMAGLASSDWTWTVKIADLDNDGANDVFFTNGMARNFTDSDVRAPANLVGAARWEFFKDKAARKERNLAFRGTGSLEFEDVGQDWGLDHFGMSYAAAHADLDLDGDLDLVVANLDEGVSIYENRVARSRSILLRLRGTSSNRFGIGSVVRLTTSTGDQVRQLQPVSGYLSSCGHVLHFGLGDSERVSQLAIDWPSGIRQTFRNLAADKIYTVTESGEAFAAAPDDSTPTMFALGDLGTRVIHRETEHDDFVRQPLLPNKMSRWGPAMALGDIDDDGDDDLFLGQGAGWMGMLYRRLDDGRFVPDPQDCFANDDASEDMGAVFFDADSDGDLDLYVASGGYEFEVGDTRLQDRVYLNNGRGGFAQAPDGTHPRLTGSNGSVAAADFDRDGDLDLFVGGRMVPGKYPLGPTSHLLRNDDGVLRDATQQVAQGLGQSGMVTSALWSDIDRDGWTDLLLTVEWGPVRVWRNQQGELVDATADVGLADKLGWWNGIAGGDVDHDGDVDYVVTNWGWNTKYHASAKHPVLLFYGDFAGSGQSNLVEAEYEDEILYPIRGRSCSSRAMPFIADKFKSYRDFATATLSDIYSPNCLDESSRFVANTLATGLLVNQGGSDETTFEFQPLPAMVQMSPAFAPVITEIDGDGHPDILIVQNFFHPQWETGRAAGGLGVALLGEGDGTFHLVGPKQSGVIIPDDARSLVATDLNDDHRPDFLIGVNDGDLLTLMNQLDRNVCQELRLNGPKGNRHGVGARITVHTTEGLETSYEVVAGGGYLSQSSPTIFLGVANDDQLERLEVHWSDGAMSQREFGAEVKPQSAITVSHLNARPSAVKDDDRFQPRNKEFAADHVAHGLRMFEAGKTTSAIALFRQAFLADPTSRAALALLGDTYTSAGNHGRAEWYFRQCLKLDPRYPAALRGLGRSRYQRGYFGDADRKLRQALALAPNDDVALLNLANVQNARHRFDQAISTYRRILGRNASSAHAWYGLGVASWHTQKIEDAIQAVSRAAELDPAMVKQDEMAAQIAEIMCGYAKELADQGKRKSALAWLSKAAQAHASYAPAYSEAGHVWLAENSPERAIAAYRRACQLNTKDWSTWNNLAWLLATNKKSTASEINIALRSAQIALDMDQSRAGSYDTLSVALAASGKFEEAVRLGEQGRQLALKAKDLRLAERIGQRVALFRDRKRFFQP